MKLIRWPQNTGCENISMVETCHKNICTYGSILSVSGSTKNEKIEVILKFDTEGTNDSYEKSIIIKKEVLFVNP